MDSDLREYINKEEELVKTYNNEEITRLTESNVPLSADNYIVGITNRRILFLDQEGMFKDIKSKNVLSVEATGPSEEQSVSKKTILGAIGGILILISLGTILENIIAGIIFLLIGSVLVFFATKLAPVQNSARTNEIDIVVESDLRYSVELKLSRISGESPTSEFIRAIRSS